MAEVPPITIRLNEQELKEQVTGAIAKALQEVSWKFRQAADALDPDFVEEERKWIEDQIEKGVEKKLKEQNDD